MQDTPTLELFTKNIKTEIIYKNYQKVKLEGLGSRTKLSFKI
jgi:hypothetical protein